MSNQNVLAKNKIEHEKSFANAPLKKKITFFSSIFIVIGAVMGAGIFFKSSTVLNNSQGSILFSLFCWLITIAAIIFMAMALIEIASARNDNLSIIGWCQTFNNRYIYKACKNFMVYLYIPLTFFYLPLYFIQSIQNGINAFTTSANMTQSWGWVVIMIATILVTFYFLMSCGLSSRLGNIQNIIITVINIIPVGLAIIFGIWGSVSIGGLAGGQAGVDSGIITSDQIIADFVGFIKPSIETSSPATIFSFASLSPGFGLFIAAGAIFFAYDGFYVVAGIQSEMKEPKKTPLALVFGLLIITIIYLSVAIAMSFGSTNGSPSGLEWIFKKAGVPWMYGVFQILIGIGVLSIINGFGLWAPRFIENLIQENELPFSSRYLHKLNSHKPTVGVIYSFVLSVIVILLFCIIGALGYLDTSSYGYKYGAIQIAKMYSFSDLMGTWSSVGVFLFILLVIIGALRNRTTNVVHVEKKKYLIPCAIGAILIMTPSIFITFFEPIANLFLLYQIPTSLPNYSDDVLIPRIMTVVALIISILATTLPNYIEDIYLKAKYGSILKGEINKVDVLAKAFNTTDKKIIINKIKKNRRYVLDEVSETILGSELKKMNIEEIIKSEA
ncbi:MAG: APC family permease [Ureaplasma sp.]|nr:APC family permease [Ureaplasma sp.]